MTPAARSSAVSSGILLSGPRTLYEPPFWKISALRRTLHPAASESRRDRSSGVRWMNGSTRTLAASTSSSRGSAAVACMSVAIRPGSVARAYRPCVAFEFFFESPRPADTVVVHNDDRTVWAYLRTSDGIVGDVSLFSLEAAPDEIA